jgi:hypothetical protein
LLPLAHLCGPKTLPPTFNSLGAGVNVPEGGSLGFVGGGG